MNNKIYDANTCSKNRFFTHVQNKTVLDVGCGTGNLSKYLTGLGNACFGITFSEEEAVHARRYTSKVLVGNIEEMHELPFEKEYFDVIVFADVLEHLRAPWLVLQNFRSYLHKDGEIIVSIPNVVNFKVRKQILLGKFEYQEYGILDNTHLRFFNLESACNLINTAGLDISRIDYSFWNWEFPSFIRAVLGRFEWNAKKYLTRKMPNLFATQFIIYAKKNG